MNVDEFIDVDADLGTGELATDEEILEQVLHEADIAAGGNDGQDFDPEDVQVVPLTRVVAAAEDLLKFYA